MRRGECACASATSAGSSLGERAEQTAQLGGAEPEVIVAEQRVVDALAILGDAFPVLAGQLDVALQRGSERGEVIALACQAPALLALRAGLREFGGELLGHPPGALPVTPRDAHDVAVELLERLPVELLQPRAELLGGRPFVGQSRERPQLLRARRRALAGHHHELVPGGQHAQRGQVGQLGHALAQLFEGAHAQKGTGAEDGFSVQRVKRRRGCRPRAGNNPRMRKPKPRMQTPSLAHAAAARLGGA